MAVAKRIAAGILVLAATVSISGCSGGGFSLSDEDRALYEKIIGSETEKFLDLNPDYHIGYKLTFAELTGDEHAEMIITMCTEDRNSLDYIYTINDGEIEMMNSWHSGSMLDGNLLADRDGGMWNEYRFSPEVEGAKVNYYTITRLGNSGALYFDFLTVTAKESEAFTAGIDRIMMMKEGNHYLSDEDIEKYRDGSGYGFYAIDYHNLLELDEDFSEELENGIISSDLDTNSYIVNKKTYDIIHDAYYNLFTDPRIPALTSELIAEPTGYDLSNLKRAAF